MAFITIVAVSQVSLGGVVVPSVAQSLTFQSSRLFIIADSVFFFFAFDVIECCFLCLSLFKFFFVCFLGGLVKAHLIFFLALLLFDNVVGEILMLLLY